METKYELKKPERSIKMGCGNEISDWDDRAVQDSLAGKNTGFDPKMLAEVMPEVERAIEERCIECLHENVENAQNELREKLAGREPTDLVKLDLRTEPTEKEYNETYRIGKEIGMESYEIANYPIIMGIKDPETLERIPDMENRIKEEMGNLHRSKLSPWFRDAEVVDRIMFVDKDEPSKERGKGKAGAVLGKGELVKEPRLSRVAHIFRDPDIGKLPEGQRTHRATIHEICHLNMFKSELTGEPSEFERVFRDHQDEWETASVEQMTGPYAVSEYAAEGFKKAGVFDPEFIAEHVAHWDADLGVEMCPEMKEFFDKYLT